MCLIMTMIAAAVTGVMWFARRKKGLASKSLFTLFLAFVAAALMWCVDGIASIAKGEPFFTISGEDVILGAIIIVLGFFIFGLLSILERARKKLK